MSCHVMDVGQVTELDLAHEAGLKLQEREPRLNSTARTSLHFDLAKPVSLKRNIPIEGR
jgi:hypothetical protein